MNGLYQPLNFKKWIEENRALLKPPVGNKLIWRDRDLIVMVVGGPNARTDFHVNQTEEFFHQIEGSMTLKIIDGEGPKATLRDIQIGEGDIYLLPPGTPHSPQRPAGTIGMVIELKRKEGQLDGLQWYCEKCSTKLYEEFFHLTNIETQFQDVFARYYDSPHTKCRGCGHVNGRKWSDT